MRSALSVLEKYSVIARPKFVSSAAVVMDPPILQMLGSLKRAAWFVVGLS
jgi:hypothetical protein